MASRRGGGGGGGVEGKAVQGGFSWIDKSVGRGFLSHSVCQGAWLVRPI
jgi:hypothetical protein